MGTIAQGKRKNESVGYLAQIIIKRDGEIAHRENRTSNCSQAAAAWLEKHKKEPVGPGEQRFMRSA